MSLFNCEGARYLDYNRGRETQGGGSPLPHWDKEYDGKTLERKSYLRSDSYPLIS
jgi:hypothetical protein